MSEELKALQRMIDYGYVKSTVEELKIIEKALKVNDSFEKDNGISIEVLSKVLKDGFYKRKLKGEIVFVNPNNIMIDFAMHCIREVEEDENVCELYYTVNSFDFKDCGSTWALTAEGLQNG